MGKGNNIVQKLLISLMTISMLLPSTPITIHAENEGTEATPAPTETTTPESTEQPVNGDTIVQKEGNSVVEINSDTTSSSETTEQPEASPEETTPADKSQPDKNASYETEDDILNYVDGDKDKAKMYEFWQDIAKHDIQENTPFASMNIGGMGTLKVIREDGSYTEYRFDHTEPVNYDAEGNVIPTDYTTDDDKVPSYVYSYTDKKSDLSDAYLQYPTYRLEGQEGEKVHIVATPDDGEQVRLAYEEKISSTIRNKEFTSMVNEDEKQDSYEFDYTFESGVSDNLTVYFTDNQNRIPVAEPSAETTQTDSKISNTENTDNVTETSSKSSKNEVAAVNNTKKFKTARKSKISTKSVSLKNAMASGSTSGSGTLGMTINTTNWENSGREDGDRFANSWKISANTSNEDFNELVREAGGSIIVQCNTAGSPAPRVNRNYNFDWNMSIDGNGNRIVTVHVKSDEINWKDQYSGPVVAGRAETSNHLQGASGTFNLGPVYYDLSVKINKTLDSQKSQYLTANSNRNEPGFNMYAGATFNVTGSDGTYYGTITTDRNGQGSLSVPHILYNVKSVHIEQTSAPFGLAVAGPWDIQINRNGATGTVVLNDDKEEVTPTSVTAYKQDSETNAAISGAQFNMASQDVSGLNYTINGNSSIDVWRGRYTVTETVAPDGYYLDNTAQTVNVQDGNANSFTFKDIPIKINVLKVLAKKNDDPTNSSKVGDPVAGAVLQLRDTNSTRTPLEQWTTTTTAHQLGTGTLLNGWNGKLQHGHSYEVVEIDVPNGWELSDQVMRIDIPNSPTNDIRNGQVPLYSYGNTELNYAVEKVDAISGVRVAGAVLQLKEKGSDRVLETWTTKADSVHYINKNDIKVNHRYVIHETTPSKGYYIPARDLEFTAQNTGGQLKIESVQEYPIQYSINKVDADTNASLAGAELTLYDKADPTKEIIHWTTTEKAFDLTNDENGNRRNILEAGHTYLVQETKTIKGYYLNETPTEFTVSEKSNGSYEQNMIVVRVKNHPITAYVGKKDALTNKPLANAKLNIYELGLFRNRVSADPVTTVSTVDIGDGTERIWDSQHNINLLEAGKTYEVEEVDPPAGYFMASGDDGKVTFRVPATWEEALRTYANGKVTVFVYDYPIKIAFAKLDQNGMYVKDAHLTLHKVNDDGTIGSTIDEWDTKKEDHLVSGVNGISGTTNAGLVAGNTYILRETSTAPGYYYSDDIKFTIPKTISGEALERVKRGESAPVQIHTIIGDGNTVQTVNKVTMTDVQIDWRLRKVDDKGNLLTLKNNDAFEFKVYELTGTGVLDADADPIAILSTKDASYITNGYWRIDPTLLKAGSTYLVRETHTPKGWMPATHDYKVKIDLKPNTNETDIPLVSYTPAADNQKSVVETYWYGAGNNQDFGNKKCIGTTIVDAPFHLYFKKVSNADENGENGTPLVRYFDQNDLKYKPFTFQILWENTSDGNSTWEVVGTFNTDNEEYRKNHQIDISQYLTWGENYMIREINEETTTSNEKDAYAYGYYRAADKMIRLTVDDQTKESTLSMFMDDKSISARFRKENYRGEPVAYVDADGTKHGNPEEYSFRIYDITDSANEFPVKDFDLTEADEHGYVQFGDVLQEGHTYRIDEVTCPPEWKGDKTVIFTIPNSYANVANVPNLTKNPSGWVTEDGKRRYLLANGTGDGTKEYASNVWLELNDRRYHFNTEKDIDGLPGYLDTNKLITDSSGTYYVDGDGIMVTNTWVGTRHFGSDGKCDYKK